MAYRPKRYWRLNYSTESILEQMITDSSAICTDRDFVLGLQIGDGILLAKFDEATRTGNVNAIGIVSGINRTTSLPVINWVKVTEKLFPSSQGQRYWKQVKPYFEFARTVVANYRLDAMFEKYLPTVTLQIPESNVATQNPKGKPDSNIESTRSGGYIYVIESQYGFKIGKTKRMKDRAQLFSVKLPFPIEVVHFAWFDDYSLAEHQLHQMFKAKRMEGEWFSLNSEDLLVIKQFGDQ